MALFRLFLFRLFPWRYFVFSHGVISSFRLFACRLFVAKRRKTPCEKTTRCNNAKQKDEKTPCEKTKKRKDATRKMTKFKFQMASFRMAFFSSFRAKISSCGVTGFVFLLGVILSFRMAFFRHFVFFAWRFFAAKRQKDERKQTGHHIKLFSVIWYQHTTMKN